jgi:hypothetical protein
MTGGNWDGSKSLKTNKELNNAISFNEDLGISKTSNSNNNVQQSLRSITKIDKDLATLTVKLVSIERGNSAIKRLEDLYGFVGIELFRVTSSGSKLLKSFADRNKYFFNKTEDTPFATNFLGICFFPNQPNYIREFQISEADWNNPDVKFEIRFWHHIKGKIYGPNRDYGKFSEVINLKTVKVDKDNRIKLGKDYLDGKNRDSIIDLDFANSNAEFEITLKS